MSKQCLVCSKKISVDSCFCRYCKTELKRIDGNVCRICGIGLISEKEICLKCRDSSFYFKTNTSLYYYRGHIPFLVSALKNKKNMQVASYFANEFSLIIKQLYSDALVVPVPCRPANKRKRGYDQLQILVHILNASYGINTKNLLYRKNSGKSQKLLSQEARISNIKDRIIFKGKNTPAEEKILLVDDVYTTGATLNECARVLKQNGAKEICTLTIARD